MKAAAWTLQKPRPGQAPGLKRQCGRERQVLETREVLAACYLGPNKGPHTGHRMLSHACWIDRSGEVVEVLCGRVSELSIADRYAHNIEAEPSCETCQRRKRKLEEAAA